MTPSAVKYAWRQLADRAGLPDGLESLGISVHYSEPDRISSHTPNIIVAPCQEVEWHTLIDRKQASLDFLPIDRVVPEGVQLPFNTPIPVLFWGHMHAERQTSLVKRRSATSIIFNADIIATTIFMLGRWEEINSPHRDEHGRFPALESVAYRQGFLCQPIIDQYALILQTWIKVLCPDWEPQRKKFTIRLSHDIDFINHFGTPRAVARQLKSDLWRQRSVPQALSTLRQLYTQIVHPENDAYVRGIYELADLSVAHGLRSDFYFMAAKPSDLDTGYNPSAPLLKDCFNYLRQQGHEIGFHPGYHTLEEPTKFKKEKERLESALGASVHGGRQHFLRFQVPETWRCWEQHELSYDSTVGYADHEGFRCGTCHPFHPFDIEQDREMRIVEYPLIVMDATLRLYRSLTPDEGRAKIMELAIRCKEVQGVFTLLWHNSSLDGVWEDWKSMYRGVVPELSQLKDSSSSQVYQN